MAIWERVVNPEAGDLAREAAECLLRIQLPEPDRQRVNELAEKARLETLTAEEQRELANYRHVGRLLELCGLLTLLGSIVACPRI